MQYTTEAKREATTIVEKFDQLGIAVEPIEVAKRISTHYSQHSLSVEKAADLVASTLRQRHKISDEDYENAGSQADAEVISGIDAKDEWITVRAEIVDVWDTTSDKIEQVGLCEDGTDKIKYTCFNPNIRELEEGQTYLIQDAVTSEFNGKYEVVLNKATTVKPIDDRDHKEAAVIGSDAEDQQSGRDTDMPTGASFDTDDAPDSTETTEITGNVVAIDEETSGVVEECPTKGCGLLDDGVCGVHGPIAEDDRHRTIRANVTIEDQDGAHNVTIPADIAKEIIDSTREDAVRLQARSPADNPTRDKLVCELLCNWVTVEVEDSTAAVQDITINPDVDPEVVRLVADTYEDKF
jgi:replication factor A1